MDFRQQISNIKSVCAWKSHQYVQRIELISPDGTTSMVLEEGIQAIHSLNFEFTSNHSGVKT